jgi:hypothetical protein
MVQKLKQRPLRFCPRFEQKHRENMQFRAFHARHERQPQFIAIVGREHLELDFQSLLGSPRFVAAHGNGD